MLHAAALIHSCINIRIIPSVVMYAYDSCTLDFKNIFICAFLFLFSLYVQLD